LRAGTKEERVAKTAVVEHADGLTTAELAVALGVASAADDTAHVNLKQLDRVAHLLASDPRLRVHEPARWDDARFWNVEAEAAERSQYFAIGNAINFRFWERRDGAIVPASGVIGGDSFRGAMYMWRSLRRALDAGQFLLLDAGFLRQITEDEFDSIFGDDDGLNPLAPAKTERLANLRDLGAHLQDHWDGLFYNLLQSTEGSLIRFAQLSSVIRAFDDPVLKLTMVNAILHGGSGVYDFRDEPLPGIDYHLLRHLLRQGILEPHPEVAEKLTTGLFLTAEEAIGLRRAALAAFVELSRSTGISGAILDNHYWLNRVNCTDTPVCLDPETAGACPFLDACSQRVGFGLPLELTRYY
jgi:hypothetical protein